MSANENGSEAIVFGSPVAVGHVRPLMPLAKRLAERGFHVVWAISGDDNEPASKWREAIGALGVTFVDLDAKAPFPRGNQIQARDLGGVLLRIIARANDIAAPAADVVREAIGGRRVRCGVYDYFGLWAYVVMRRLGIEAIDVVVSAFPSGLGAIPNELYGEGTAYARELAQVHAAGFGSFGEAPRDGLIPRDPAVRILNFSSPHLCTDAPKEVTLLGVQVDALPKVDDNRSIPPDHEALVSRLRSAREAGTPVVLLSMGTVVMRLFSLWGAAHIAFLRRLYTTLAASALRSNALVVASTSQLSAAELGIDEATLGPAARDRVIAMPFVPQPLLFAHGLVDAMLMHGGANTFHEVVAAGVPCLVSPGFGDQEHVAKAAARLGVGVCIEAVTYPGLDALPLDRVAEDVLPAMLARGNRWKSAATELSARIWKENGLDAAEALVVGPR